MREVDFFWLAGLLEGEGSFLKGPPSKPNSPIVCVQMTDEDVIFKVSLLFGAKYYKIVRKNKKHKPVYVTKITGLKAVRFMEKVRSLMGTRRQVQIDNALNSYDSSVYYRRYDRLKKLTDEKIEEARLRVAGGLSIRKVAKELGVDHETLRQRLRGRKNRFERFDIVFNIDR